MTGPIKPKDIAAHKETIFPEEVFKVFNDLITENFSCGSAEIKQKDVIERLIKALEIPREEIFKRGYLNVEDVYRKAGWKVSYDKPGYCETYEPTFTFRK